MKLDIVTYILQTNGFPAGTTELKVGSSDLATAQILNKGEQAAVQNFSLVQAVGCLATGPNNTWLLTRTAEPVTTRDDAPSERGLVSAASKPLGTRTFRLISVTPFKPEAHAGQKMEARVDLQRAGRRTHQPDLASRNWSRLRGTSQPARPSPSSVPISPRAESRG